MSRLLATVSAIAFAALIALPGAASAAPQTTQTGVSMKTSNLIEVSSARRHHWRHRHYVRRYYGPRYYGRSYYAPYDAYAYAPYYYRPGFAVGVGPFGFGVGF